MADQKISQLNNIAGANVAADDEFVIVDTDANETKAIRADNIRAAIGLATTDSPTFAGLTVDTNTLYVDSANNRVGIGTTSPSEKLDVVGNAEINGTLTTTGVITIDSASNAIFYVDAAASGNSAEFIYRTNGSQRWSWFKDNSAESGSNAGSNLNLARFNDAGSFVDNPISITRSTGNVTIANNLGIGTTSPSEKLDVVGNAEINGTLTTTGNVTIDSASDAYLKIDRASAPNVAAINFQTNGAVEWQISSSVTNKDYTIYRYVSGVFQDAPFEIINSTGNVTIANDLAVTGALSKGSGSFKIDHPLKPDTHHLVHSFVEAPQADNIYRGRVSLVGGEATVDMDEAAGLTKGTQELLNGNWQVFVQNESGWSPVRGRIEVSTLYIECQDTTSTDTVSWLAIGSRQDQHMLDTDWTDEFGRPILEPLKPEDTAAIIGNEEPVV